MIGGCPSGSKSRLKMRNWLRFENEASFCRKSKDAVLGKPVRLVQKSAQFYFPISYFTSAKYLIVLTIWLV